MYKMLIPIAFPKREPFPKKIQLVAADIGGTKTFLTLFEIQGHEFTHLREAAYQSEEWDSFAGMFRDFHDGRPMPDRISLGIPGPVRDGVARPTNLSWGIDSRQLSRELGCRDILLINDLEAYGFGLAALEEKDLLTIYPGKGVAEGNGAIIAPGTGLGEAGLFWDGKNFHPFATEGGHTDFGPRNEQDIELLRYLQKEYRHVSWERIVAGPGIYRIYKFLREVGKWEEPAWLKEKISKVDPAEAISEGAQEACPICEETLRLFTRYLGVEAANLALKFKATGGLFIGGGIVPKIWNPGLQEVFFKYFFEVGRLQPLLEEIPVHIILNPKTALLGVAYYGAFGHSEKTRGVLSD